VASLLSTIAAFLSAQPRHAQRDVGGRKVSTPASTRGGRQNQENLEQWIDRHGSLPIQQQLKALENEPGFQQLPAETQQRMRDRLTQLNNMSVDERRRRIERSRALDSLPRTQQTQVFGVLGQLRRLPENRRRLVVRTFRNLLEMPPEQRQTFLASDRFKQFSDQERSTISNLLTVEAFFPLLR
jgi:hypothetical protein